MISRPPRALAGVLWSLHRSPPLRPSLAVTHSVDFSVGFCLDVEPRLRDAQPVLAMVLRNCALVLAAGSAALYWWAYFDHRDATAERRAAAASTAMPIPLNGFRIALRGVEPVSAGHSAAVPGPNTGVPWLFFVVSDSCPGSDAAVPLWTEWIKGIRHRDFGAVVVSMDGSRHLSLIADALAGKGVEATLMSVSQVQEFSLATGVTVTPTVLGIDGRGSVRFAGGHFTDAARRVLEDFLGRPSAVSGS